MYPDLGGLKTHTSGTGVSITLPGDVKLQCQGEARRAPTPFILPAVYYLLPIFLSSSFDLSFSICLLSNLLDLYAHLLDIFFSIYLAIYYCSLELDDEFASSCGIWCQ